MPLVKKQISFFHVIASRGQVRLLVKITSLVTREKQMAFSIGTNALSLSLFFLACLIRLSFLLAIDVRQRINALL
jgi:hypothetical protein